MRCYCSVCRKTGGGGGYAINLHADADSLRIQGQEHIVIYRAFLDYPRREQRSDAERRFCKHCATALWLWDPNWPELIHPFASAIDTELGAPPERNHIFLEDKPAWVQVPPESATERHFAQYPDEALIDWHRRHGLQDEKDEQDK